MGYHRAGFEVVGVDVVRQPHYPFTFHQADAMSFPLEGFEAIHASPPCKAFTVAQRINGLEYPDLLTPTRERLQDWGSVWVMENVPGAPMRPDVTLCGSAFDLQVQRHRQFEFGFPFFTMMAPCYHLWEGDGPVGVYGHTGTSANFDPTQRGRGNHGWEVADWRRAMDIDWMARDELAQAIPPAYTQWIGAHLLARLEMAA
jgi:DNA (cytosine-5)-methyltransferase 1